MIDTFEYNRSILESLKSFNLLEKKRYEAPRDKRQIKFSNPLPKQIKYRCQEHNTTNNYYKGIAHIDYVKRDTPPYYGLHETGSGSISYKDFFK
jgi:hypothetical protein